MTTPMRVMFDDTKKNWELWGQLVEEWICGIVPLPKDVKALTDQGTNHGISGFTVPGSQDRNVVFNWHDPDKELSFWLPTEDMLKTGRAAVKPGPYPLPVFYDQAYAGPRRDLTADEDKLFENCRVGEYTINNCD